MLTEVDDPPFGPAGAAGAGPVLREVWPSVPARRGPLYIRGALARLHLRKHARGADRESSQTVPCAPPASIGDDSRRVSRAPCDGDI